jgi:hypothetical protein
MELVLLSRGFGECLNLLSGLSFILRKGHPLANNLSAEIVVFIHVRRLLGLLQRFLDQRATMLSWRHKGANSQPQAC